jgi:DHA1 family bicyclomycin/chloramphenicol resistance-like MFS transporter
MTILISWLVTLWPQSLLAMIWLLIAAGLFSLRFTGAGRH